VRCSFELIVEDPWLGPRWQPFTVAPVARDCFVRGAEQDHRVAPDTHYVPAGFRLPEDIAEQYDVDPWKPLHARCEGCGRPMVAWFHHARRRWTCSERCAKRAQRGRSLTDRECEECGATYTPSRSDARYCSSPCRQRSYRARKAPG
jgi:hypothetical protein